MDLVGVCWAGGEHLVNDVTHSQVLLRTGHCSPIELRLLQTLHEEDGDQSSHQQVLRADLVTDEEVFPYLFIGILTLSLAALLSGQLHHLLDT